MAISFLVKIDSTDITAYLKKFKVGRNKLWANADRNMAGDLRSTFIGIFPKLSLEFAPISPSTMRTLIGLLDQPSFTVTWYDEYEQATVEGTYYASDYEYSIYNIDLNFYEGFTANLIPFSKYEAAIPSA